VSAALPQDDDALLTKAASVVNQLARKMWEENCTGMSPLAPADCTASNCLRVVGKQLAGFFYLCFTSHMRTRTGVDTTTTTMASQVFEAAPGANATRHVKSARVAALFVAQVLLWNANRDRKGTRTTSPPPWISTLALLARLSGGGAIAKVLYAIGASASAVHA